MFEKLLSLLLHAKGGAVATVLVLGASGALVTATVENGVANVTVTQPSQTTTGSDTTTSTNNTVTQQILALFNRTKAEDDPSAPATGNGCSDAAHETNAAVQLVNDGFKTDHAAVQALGKNAPKTDAARTLVRTADGLVKDWRQVGVKAIHELFKSDECKGNVDEDTVEDNDDEGDDTVALSCTDAKACADAAIKEMDKAVADLETALGALTAAPATTTTTKTEKGKSDSKSGKGKSHSEGRQNHDDD